MLIVSRKQLEVVLREYVAYYNDERPHRSLDLRAPVSRGQPRKAPSMPTAMSHTRPMPRPLTTLLARNPATPPTMIQTMNLVMTPTARREVPL
jgi:hypothetical protein